LAASQPKIEGVGLERSFVEVPAHSSVFPGLDTAIDTTAEWVSSTIVGWAIPPRL